LQNTIDQAGIIAPFSGTVTAIDSVAGEQVAAGDSALQLDNLSNLTVELQISQLDIPKIISGQPADITFSAIPNQTYQGLVADISSAGTEVSGETVFNVRITVIHPDDKVKPGFTAIVAIVTQQAENALLVPNAAIQYKADGSAYVMAANNSGGFIEVPIETGAHSDAFTELKSGNLKEGDSVALVQVKDTTLQFGPNRRSTNP
jgi:HlyD family secretion protein